MCNELMYGELAVRLTCCARDFVQRDHRTMNLLFAMHKLVVHTRAVYTELMYGKLVVQALMYGGVTLHELVFSELIVQWTRYTRVSS